MRGESLDPGGCSATPTSGRMALRIACPALVGAGVLVTDGGAAVARLAAGDGAASNCSKLVLEAEGVADVAGVVAVDGLNSDCSWDTRARAMSKLMHIQLRHSARRALTQTGGLYEAARRDPSLGGVCVGPALQQGPCCSSDRAGDLRWGPEAVWISKEDAAQRAPAGRRAAGGGFPAIDTPCRSKISGLEATPCRLAPIDRHPPPNL